MKVCKGSHRGRLPEIARIGSGHGPSSFAMERRDVRRDFDFAGVGGKKVSGLLITVRSNYIKEDRGPSFEFITLAVVGG